MNFKFKINSWYFAPSRFFLLYQRQRRGYTLIELIVSISIIVLLSALVAPRFSAIHEEQALQNAVVELKAKLIEAQSYSLAPPSDNNKAVAYGVQIANNSDGNLIFSTVLYRDTDTIVYPSGNSNVSPNIEISDTTPIGLTIIWFIIGDRTQAAISTTAAPEPTSAGENPQIILELVSGSAIETRTITINKATGAIDVE